MTALIVTGDEALASLLSSELALFVPPLVPRRLTALAKPDLAGVSLLLFDLDTADEKSLPEDAPFPVFTFSKRRAADADFLRPFSLSAFHRRLAQSLAPSEAAEKRPDAAFSLSYRPGALTVNGKSISLSPAEEAIFSLLYENRGRPVSEQTLAARLKASPGSNAVSVHISHLRRKIDIPCGHRVLTSLRGQGYVLLL